MGPRISGAFAGVSSAVRHAGASSRQMEYRSRAWFLYGGWRDQPFLADNFGRNRGERLRLYSAGARPRFRRSVAWWDTRLLLRDARPALHNRGTRVGRPRILCSGRADSYRAAGSGALRPQLRFTASVRTVF